MTSAVKPVSEFEFGGRLCLDFTNTASDRAAESPRERLRGYDDLVAWGVGAELFGRTEAARLRAEAAARPEEAARALDRARTLREAIYRLVTASVEGRAADPADSATLNAALAEGMRWRQVFPTDEGFCWRWVGDPDGLDWLLWPIAYSAAELLTSTDVERVKVCGSESCDWLFEDVSRNRSRRWCDMRSCGNRAKARRHYARHREHGAPDA